MNLLFLSAFALSLITLPLKVSAQTESIDDFLGLEKEILPELKGSQKFTPNEINQKAAWNINVDLVEPPGAPLKGQGHSLIEWDELNPENWLDINNWMIERSLKDKLPDWKVRLRERTQNELIGKIFSCKGTCLIYRGTKPVSGQFQSRLVEGDEIKTLDDSVAWIYLLDGTLLRLGSDSSVSLNEVNFSKEEVFYHVRLNQGHVFWHPRSDVPYSNDIGPETDAISLPLKILAANQEFFERKIYQSLNDDQRLSEYLEFEEKSILAQIAHLNVLREKRATFSFPPAKVFMVAPNSSIASSSVSFNYLYHPNGKAFVKKQEKEGVFDLHLRGYNTTEVTSLDQDWYEVEADGRKSEKMSTVPAELQINELLTKRIRTIELGRELWFTKYSLPIMDTLSAPKELALKHGYVLWDDKDIAKRKEFLVEYTRRIETTHLKSLRNLVQKMASRGESITQERYEKHYESALYHYLKSLKTRYSNKKQQVREISDLQYYVWALNNGKF